MDFKAPTDWEPMEDDDAARDPAWLSRHALVAVPLDADLAVSLRQKLRESLPHARLVSLERIQHRGLWRAYARKRDDVAFYNDSDANEILLWHGTGERAPAAVLAHQEGLDPRFSSGGFYGQGIYLAERAAYPVGGRYAHRVAGHGGTRFQLLLVRVAAGAVQDFGAEVTAATKKMRFPCTAGNGRLYDCVFAGPHRPHISGAGGPGDTDASRICVVYQADQMYPAFVCTFDLSFASLPAASSSPVARTGVPAQRSAVRQRATPSQPARASPPAPSLLCPLSTGLLVQPMKARPCGHVYSAASARAYFMGPSGKKCAIFGCDKVLKWSDFVKDETLNIRLHKVPEGDVIFRVKTTTKLDTVFEAYAMRKGIDLGSLRFLLDGERLNGNQTPGDVDMEDGDQIDVFEDPTPAPKRSRQV